MFDCNANLEQLVENVDHRLLANLVVSAAEHEEPFLIQCIPVLHGRDVINGKGMVAITKLLFHKQFDRQEVGISSSKLKTGPTINDEHHRKRMVDRLDHLPGDISLLVSKP